MRFCFLCRRLLLQEPSSCGCSGPASTRPSPIQATPSSLQSSTPTSPWLPVCSLPTPSPASWSTKGNWTWSGRLSSDITELHSLRHKQTQIQSNVASSFFCRCTFRTPPWPAALLWERAPTWTSGRLELCWLDLSLASSPQSASSS